MITSSHTYSAAISDGGDSIISARPSGTEPKIKFYCSVNEKLPDKKAYPMVDQQLEIKIGKIMKDLKL